MLIAMLGSCVESVGKRDSRSEASPNEKGRPKAARVSQSEVGVGRSDLAHPQPCHRALEKERTVPCPGTALVCVW